jgi:hypothetical protein
VGINSNYGEKMTTPPKWYKIIAIIALIWNLFGCFATMSDLMIKPEDVAKLSPGMQTLYTSRTTWSVIASLTAVIGGTIGSLGLLLRKKWALTFLIASLVGLLAQDYGLFVVAGGAGIVGAVGIVLQALVFLIAIGLIMLCRSAVRKGWMGGAAATAPGKQ